MKTDRRSAQLRSVPGLSAIIAACACFLVAAMVWSAPLLAQETAPADAPIAPQAATDTARATETVWATGVEYVEAEAHIVKVVDDSVYVDAGGSRGIVPGAEMTYFESVAVTDLDGKPLGTDLVAAGALIIEHVDDNMSTASIAQSRIAPARGMLVKYLAPKIAVAATGEEKTNCPQDMQLVASGSFAYTPGALSRDAYVENEEFKAETAAFCMDIEPQDKKLTWREARDFCGAQGKRLCGREEQRKACVQNSRRPACTPEQARAGDCPRGQAVMGFESTLEWTGAWIEDDPATGAPTSKTGSCSCTGQRPASAVCYYPECRGITKKFRCCADPQ